MQGPGRAWPPGLSPRPREAPGSRNTASIGAAAYGARSACTVSPSGLGPEPGSGSPVLSGRPAVSPPLPPVRPGSLALSSVRAGAV